MCCLQRSQFDKPMLKEFELTPDTAEFEGKAVNYATLLGITRGLGAIWHNLSQFTVHGRVFTVTILKWKVNDGD